MTRRIPTPSRVWGILDELGRHSPGREEAVVRRLRRLPARELHDLIDGLRLHPNVFARAAVARALPAFGLRAVSPLMHALRDPAMPVRLYALRSLDRMWTPRMASPVMRLLDDPSAGIRHNAAVVLGRRGAIMAGRRLMNALDDPVWHVRQQAVRALGILQIAARGVLVRASVDPRRAVREAAREALAAISEESRRSSKRSAGRDRRGEARVARSSSRRQ